jgi:hypothetical protein
MSPHEVPLDATPLSARAEPGYTGSTTKKQNDFGHRTFSNTMLAKMRAVRSGSGARRWLDSC